MNEKFIKKISTLTNLDFEQLIFGRLSYLRK